MNVGKRVLHRCKHPNALIAFRSINQRGKPFADFAAILDDGNRDCLQWRVVERACRLFGHSVSLRSWRLFLETTGWTLPELATRVPTCSGSDLQSTEPAVEGCMQCDHRSLPGFRKDFNSPGDVLSSAPYVCQTMAAFDCHESNPLPSSATFSMTPLRSTPKTISI